MFRRVEDFLAEWTAEAAATQRVMNLLSDESLKQETAPGFRTLGELAWHIVTAYGSILHQTGLVFPAPDKRTPVPAAQEIAEEYGRVVEAVKTAVKASWTDESLQEQRMLYGEPWTNGRTLRILLSHEIHHRAQMSVLMRQAGLRVPELYGPTKEQELERQAAKRQV